MNNKGTRNFFVIILVLTILLVTLIWKSYEPYRNTNVPQETESTQSYPLTGKRTKTSGCNINVNLPDPACTPGDILPEATKDKICVSGYTKNVRDVSDQLKNEVYREYGIISHSPGEYEVDHLISLELGGSNDIANLWPEPAEPKPGFKEKDQVENYLHMQVCNGFMSLNEAQKVISSDWTQVLVLIK